MTRWLPGPSLDRNPVFWRECHRSRPSFWMTVVLTLLMGTTGVLCIIVAVAFWKNGMNPNSGSLWDVAGICSYLLHVIFGLLMLSVIAPTSLAEERQRGSLEILAVTALSTRSIVIGKWLATIRLTVLMTICPGLLALSMATARFGGTFPPATTSTPPDEWGEISLGTRIFGVIVLIATIFAHGALLASIGLALAVWIKRQSRAIAASVGSFILITAAWPIFIAIAVSRGPDLGRDLAALSPVVVCGLFVQFFMTRWHAFSEGILWCSTFWALEVFVLAVGLLWLTVRTFDGCFDRIPERQERISVRAVLITILAGMIGAGSVVAAVGNLIVGIKPQGLSGPSVMAILVFSLVVAIGLVLVALESAQSAQLKRIALSGAQLSVVARNVVLGRWWESFRLVLFLAIGPALLALALATAHKPPRYEPQYTKNAAGAQVVSSWVLVKEDNRYDPGLKLAQRFLIAAVIVVTILAHGAAAIAVGLGLTTVVGASRHTLTVAVGLTLLVVLALPIYLFVAYNGQVPATATWSFVMASASLLALLVSRWSVNIGDTVWPILFWNVVAALLATALAAWTIWAWRRRSSGVCKAKSALTNDLHDGIPAPEAALAGD